MLQSLRIRNLAIIDELELEIQPGFTALTGETGAGKSIIIGALNLILGERASSEDVRSGCEKAEVEALFELGPQTPAAKWLQQWDPEMEAGEELIIRREVSAQGRSRAFINGRITPLRQLRELGDLLTDLHGQHQHQSLLHVENHRAILDDQSGEEGERARSAFAELYQKHRKLRKTLNKLNRDEREVERQKGILEFQIHEIHEADPAPDEMEALQEERERLRHVDSLRQHTAFSVEALYEGENLDHTVTDLLGRCEEEMTAAARMDPSLESTVELIAEARVRVEEAVNALRTYGEKLEADPQRLEEIEARLHLLKTLCRKYGGSLPEVLAEAERMEEELHGLTHQDEEQERLRKELEGLEKNLGAAAEKLTACRKKTAQGFAKSLLTHLKDLDMAKARFEARVEPMTEKPAPEDEEEDGEEEPLPKPAESALIPLPDGQMVRVNETGADQVEFLISPNAGEELKPLRKIASGGELSRIMLALKALTRSQTRVPVLVFDEIDTGISGQTGSRVGEKMARLAENCQVLCITHLPQIAARASHHFAVEKEVVKKRTLTRLKVLKKEDREKEIARLLGGETDSVIALEHARQLLAQSGS